ncbi:hypothetical protein HDV00_003526 [Rhizophlyctis rosea]|nr:hypothetical protein HDV00_003526 [Rhizophlyctis rosea]
MSLSLLSPCLRASPLITRRTPRFTRGLSCKTKRHKPKHIDLSTLPCDCVAGTAAPPLRHALITTNLPDWPSHADSDPYPLTLTTTLKRASTKVSLTSLPSLTSNTHDILLFPAFIRFPNVTPSDFPSLARRIVFEDVHPPPEPWDGEQKLEEKQYFLVCTHASRDKRCGERGVPVMERLKEIVKKRRAEGNVGVAGVSHIGGHKYAGNVISWPSGDWYGLVRPEDAEELYGAVMEGRVLWKFWRGRAGLEKQEAVDLWKEHNPHEGESSSIADK